MEVDSQLTEALNRLARGQEVPVHLFESAHEGLGRMAASLLRQERQDHTLSIHDLVGEAYLRFTRARDDLRFNSRAEFYALFRLFMRRVLLDHARRRNTGKRMPPGTQLYSGMIDEIESRVGLPHVDFLDLAEALERLEMTHPHEVQIVEFRFFFGLSDHEIGELLRLPRRRVQQKWHLAKALLARRLGELP